MTRAALYARYSSDNQREASIEDQFRLCREHAARERWRRSSIPMRMRRSSGASTILRPGIQRLMRDAQQGEFNILLAEALDRISRDQADVATLYKHLRYLSVTIVTLAEDEISRPCRAERHDERAVPQRPCHENSSRPAGQGGKGQGGRWSLLRLQGGEKAGRQWRADPW